MLSTLNKYRHAFLVGLQGNIVYRWNFAVRGFFSLFHLTAVFVLWTAAYLGGDTINGYTLDQTLTYFVTLFVLQFFIGAFNEDYQISEDIRNGLINQFLLKPISYYGYRLSIFVAARLVSGALVLVPLAVALPFIGTHLSLPEDWGWRLALGPPAMLLSALIQFGIAYCFGLLTFWFLEIQGFVILSMAIESVLGGQMFPLDLLPKALEKMPGLAPELTQTALQLLPFYYQMYFPAAIFTGRIDEATALRGLCIELGWVLVLFAVNRALWTRGLRRHTAVGG